jgi:hypothetical protein
MFMEECCSLNIVGRGSLKATSLLSISDGTKKTLCLSRHETQAPKTLDVTEFAIATRVGTCQKFSVAFTEDPEHHQ